MISSSNFGLLALSMFGAAMARVDPLPDGNILACHEQQCDDCPTFASVNAGFPDCITYPSDGNLKGYEADGGNGYDVWWNSGDPAPGCKIVVRTPASTDLPACGYFLRDWDVGGCYYTSIQQSFMLQYCCGTGDCDAAAPAKRSIAEVHALHLRGISSSTNLVFDNFNATEDGKIDLGPAGELSYRRTPTNPTHKARGSIDLTSAWEANQYARERTANIAKNGGEAKMVGAKRCDDSFTLRDTYTKGGRQVRVSPTQVCNSQDGCALTIESSVTVGYSVSFTAGFDIEVVSASVSTEFSEEQTSSVSTMYTQLQGTTGYVSFIPTLKCYGGTYSSCDTGDEDGEVCNPQYFGTGDSKQPDGTYSFVYV